MENLTPADLAFLSGLAGLLSGGFLVWLVIGAVR